MKRALLSLLVFLSLAAGASAQDEALTWGVSGSLRVRGFYLSNGTLARELDPTTLNSLRISGNDDIDSTQEFLDTRLRLQLKATMVEEVSAFLALEVGDLTFGVANAGGALGTDGVVIENKNLYLEWHPKRYSFRVRAGLYARESDPYGIILSNDVAGVQGEVELLGLNTSVYGDVIKAVESSRLDLDGDGKIDNDYNDRTIFIVGMTNASLDAVAFESFFMADIDNTQDTPVAANTEQDVYWLGLTARTRIGPAELASTVIGAYGRRTVKGQPGVHIRGLAMDHRVTLQLPFVTAEGIFGWASGRDPKRRTTDEGFPVVTPFYGQSGIVYGNFGGFNATGSNLSGTAHATIKLRAQPAEGLDVEAVFLWAWYTSDRDVSQAVNEFDDDARDLGFEADLNVTYTILNGFKTFARGSIFFPGKGYRVERDTRRRGALAQIIIGAQLDF
jgi:hypothetical protein